MMLPAPGGARRCRFSRLGRAALLLSAGSGDAAFSRLRAALLPPDDVGRPPCEGAPLCGGARFWAEQAAGALLFAEECPLRAAFSGVESTK